MEGRRGINCRVQKARIEQLCGSHHLQLRGRAPYQQSFRTRKYQVRTAVTNTRSKMPAEHVLTCPSSPSTPRSALPAPPSLAPSCTGTPRQHISRPPRRPGQIGPILPPQPLRESLKGLRCGGMPRLSPYRRRSSCSRRGRRRRRRKKTASAPA